MRRIPISIAPRPQLLWVVDFFGQQDGSGAGAEGRFCANEFFQPFESCLAEKFEEGAGLASGDHKAIDFIQLLGLFYEHNFGTQLLEPFAMGVEIALKGKDTDANSRWLSVVGRWLPRFDFNGFGVPS